MSSLFYEKLGARIKARREEIHLRQAELAESIGLSRTSVTNIERGRQRLFLDQFADICRVLKVAPSQMIPDPASQDSERLATRSASIGPASVRKFLASIDLEEGANK
ncbi:helix-turn-helix domain-containing protein [Burkholderia gladioli]|uniref:helix-turn-helix domain-containing protein n=1 Tax=Burkholderia gladioli TaxID=28095 RepID=UPI00163FF242|nr:helix-turn-helix transcriptional regulator [Burkholderia gladioli]